MPSTSQAGAASFFGGLARGLSDAATERRQAKQAQKDAELKLQTELVVDGFKNGTIKNQPEAMAYLLKLHGAKDSDGRIRNLMDQASTLIPQYFDKATMPSTSIGLTDPSTGQAGPAASGPATSPGQSVALKSPVQATPGPPQFMSGDEIDARDLSREQKLSDIKFKHDKELAQIKADADNRKQSTTISTRGQLGLPGDPNERIQHTVFESGREIFEPVEARVDNSPEARLAKAYKDLKSEDPEVRAAANDVIKQNQQGLVVKVMQAKTAAARLELLQQTMPLTIAQKKNQIEGEKLLNDIRDATLEALAGDAKHVMDLATKQAAKLVTEKDGQYYGHSADEVTDIVLHQMGFDPEQTKNRIKPPSSMSQLVQDSTGGGSTQGNVAPANTPAPGAKGFDSKTIKWTSVPADLKANVLRDHPNPQPGIYTDKATGKTLTINRDGTTVVK